MINFIQRLRGKTLKISLIALSIALIAIISVTGMMVLAQTPTPTPTVTTPAVTPNITPTPTPTATLLRVQGKVTSIAADHSSVVIQSNNQSVTIKVDQNTKYSQIQSPGFQTGPGFRRMPYYHGNGGMMGKRMPWNSNMQIPFLPMNRTQPASISNLAVGDNLIARVNADNLAHQVLIIKPSNIKHVQGTVSEMAGNSFTITPSGGTAVKLTWDSNTQFYFQGATSLQNGQTVRVLYESTNMTAKLVREGPLPASKTIPTPSTSPKTTP
jgi:hypothetical protein